MNPKVLSIYNNAKIFLSPGEMEELRACIDKDFAKVETKQKKELKELPNWTLELVTERLLATHFHPSNKKHIKAKLNKLQ